MRVIITGASGLVGGTVMRKLLAGGHEVLGTAHGRPAPGLTPLDLLRPGDAAALVASWRPDAVVHCAALTHVDRCEDEPSLAWRLIAEATSELAGAARETGAFLALTSSDYVFDGTGPRGEDDALRPLNVYGAAKAAAELAVRAILPRSSAVLRTTGVYGWQPGGMNFVLQLQRRLLAGERMLVPSDQRANPTSARSLAAALQRVCETRTSGTFHACGEAALTRIDFARRACAVFGWDPSLLDPVATAALGQRALRPLDNPMIDTRLRALTGAPLEGPDAGLAAMRAEMESSHGH